MKSIGRIQQIFNFRMPINWNKLNEYEQLNKSLEMENAWKSYFESKNNYQEAKQSWVRILLLKDKITRLLNKRSEEYNQLQLNKLNKVKTK